MKYLELRDGTIINIGRILTVFMIDPIPDSETFDSYQIKIEYTVGRNGCIYYEEFDSKENRDAAFSSYKEIILGKYIDEDDL